MTDPGKRAYEAYIRANALNARNWEDLTKEAQSKWNVIASKKVT